MMQLSDVPDSSKIVEEDDRDDLMTSYTEAVGLLMEAAEVLKSTSRFLKKEKKTNGVKGKLDAMAAEIELFIEATE